jgi:hypothetical protein
MHVRWPGDFESVYRDNPENNHERTTMRILLLLCTALTCLPAAADDGATEIFNGKDLSGWVVDGGKTYQDKDGQKPVWSVQDGLIVCAGAKFGFLRYDKVLTDFAVHVEYRMSKGCNSGIGIRTVKFTGPARTRPSYASYEIQVLDDAGKAPGKGSSGSLYRHLAPKVNATRPAGQWNVMDIECRGPHLRITLNGQLLHDLDQTTVEGTKDKPLSGYFCLQSHSRRIEFRNVRLKELGATGTLP